MSWISFKMNYLFHTNFVALLGVLLYGVRKDFAYHYILIFILVGGIVFSKVIRLEELIIRLLGKINSIIVLTIAFYFILTPYSLIYKLIYRNKSFEKSTGRFINKNFISSFDKPF